MSTSKGKSHFLFYTLLLFIPMVAKASGSTPLNPVINGVNPFFNSAPSTATPFTSTQLNTFYTTGIGPDVSTTTGIYSYPMTIGGKAVAAGGVLYNGCYDVKGNRLSNLDAGAITCNGAASANAGKSIFMLFMGYKIGCTGPAGPAPNICQNASITINCVLIQTHVGSGPFDMQVGPSFCSGGSGIVHAAKGSNTTTPAFVACYAGQDGTTYPTCSPCASGSFNSALDGTNTTGVSCTACSTALTPPTGSTGAITYVTPPATGSPLHGATSVGDCSIQTSPAGMTCASGYQLSLDGQTCQLACNLSISLVPTNTTSPATSDGKIVANWTGNQGAATASITAPSAIPPSSSTATSATFTPLAAGTYTVTVTDAAVPGCSRSTSIPIGSNPPTCALTVTSPSKTDPTSGNNGVINVTSSGAVGTVTYTPYGTFTPSGNNGSYTNLASGSYTISGSDSGVTGCNSPPITVTLGSSGCVHTMNVVAASSAAASDGKFDFHVDGLGAFTATFTSIPPGYAGTTSWTVPAPTTMSGNVTIPNLPMGTYTVTSTGTCNSSATATIAGTPPPTCALAFSLTGSNPTAAGNDGTLVGTTSGAVGTVSYVRSPATGSVVSSTNTGITVSGLAANTYTITATDSGVAGCSVAKSFTLTGPAGCTLAWSPAISGTDPTANGASDGIVGGGVTGGVGTITLTATGSSTGSLGSFAGPSHTWTNAKAESYTISATDSGQPGCGTFTSPSITLMTNYCNPGCPSGGSPVRFAYTQDVNTWALNNTTFAPTYNSCRNINKHSENFIVACSTTTNTTGQTSCTSAGGIQFYTTTLPCLY